MHQHVVRGLSDEKLKIEVHRGGEGEVRRDIQKSHIFQGFGQQINGNLRIRLNQPPFDGEVPERRVPDLGCEGEERGI